MAGKTAEEFILNFGDVTFQGDIGSQEPDPDLKIEDSLPFRPGRDGEVIEEGEGVGHPLAKGVDVAPVTTAGGSKVSDLFMDGGKDPGLMAGVGAEFPGVLVAGLAATPALWGRDARRRWRMVNKVRRGVHGW